METHSSILAWKIPWTEEPGSPWGWKDSDTTERAHAHTHTHTHTHNVCLTTCQLRMPHVTDGSQVREDQYFGFLALSPAASTNLGSQRALSTEVQKKGRETRV